MNPRGYIVYGMLLSCVAMVTGVRYLFNDTCQTVLIREDIANTTAKVACSEYAQSFDPKHQNGSYLMDKGSQKWSGEIFACLCSCHLPDHIENGQIMLKNQSLIQHGKMLDYSCNDGYEKSNRKIVCYDGLLVAVSDYLEKQHINISFRQKSIPDSFSLARYDVFHLVVRQSENLTVNETEVRSNQKVFYSQARNDTSLIYYMFNGDGYIEGFIDLEGRELLCTKKIPPASSGNLIEIIIPLVVIVIVLVVSLTIALVIIKKRRSQESELKKPKNQLEEEIREEEKQPMQKSEEN